jgi:serine phosphatase RsbU (regulator of sigma subunit)
MKKSILLVIILLFVNISFVPAQDTAHEHNFYNELFGDGDDEFVCYNRVHRNFYMGIFFSVAGLAVVGFSRYRIKKKAAAELTRKNMIIEEKNKDITDSINYAKRIQSAILPPTETIAQHFPEHFILYRPKDIVSGDFYWTAARDGKMMIAAVDCTGHGVPGAFLSIVGYTALNKAVNEKGLTKPSDILEELNREVVSILRQDGNPELKDGMDIALCTYDPSTSILQYAGAFNPLWLFKSDDSSPVPRPPSLEEIKADRQPVGSTVKGTNVKFTTHEVKMSKGDVFYMFSDGYADQFGGKEGKKFKVSRMKELLLSLQGKPMSEQKRMAEQALEQWKGNFEQIDDVLVIGVRI